MSSFPESHLHGAAYRFEAARGKVLNSQELSEVTNAGLRDADPSHVASLICDSLETSADLSAEYRSLAFWALGKRFDQNLRDFFRRHLAIEVNRDMHVAYQIMIALDNLGEPVWLGDRSFCITETQRNREVATRYLNESI